MDDCGRNLLFRDRVCLRYLLVFLKMNLRFLSKLANWLLTVPRVADVGELAKMALVACVFADEGIRLVWQTIHVGLHLVLLLLVPQHLFLRLDICRGDRILFILSRVASFLLGVD
jgi:hypothetical protein